MATVTLHGSPPGWRCHIVLCHARASSPDRVRGKCFRAGTQADFWCSEESGQGSPGYRDLTFVPPLPWVGSSHLISEKLSLLCPQPHTTLHQGFNAGPHPPSSWRSQQPFIFLPPQAGLRPVARESFDLGLILSSSDQQCPWPPANA